jgi:4-diphosphocytidyl-2-C-methyl-D-erythritol kinase
MPLLTESATHDISTDRMERRRNHIRPVIVRAYAKINLDLRVLGTRPDGFHELRTVFQSISLHDTVACIPREGPFAIECSAAGVPLDRSNLIWRAAEALWRALRRSGPIRDVGVRLEKRIPLQAGLGGGSADAAAALVGLARTWSVPLRPAQLTDVAATLGADVPFFLAGGTALGLGRGDEVYPLADLPRHWIVVLVPGFGVSTSEAYGWYDAERDLARGPVLREPQHVPGPWPSRSAQMINDLEVPIARHHPEIDQMKAALWPVPEAERRGGRGKSPRRLRMARSPQRIARPRGVRAAQPAATIDERMNHRAMNT